MADCLFVCPRCALICASTFGSILTCFSCEQSLLVETKVLYSEVPQVKYLGIETEDRIKYNELKRRVFEDIIKPMGQLDEDCVEFKDHYAQYYNLPKPECVRLRDEREAAEYRNLAALRQLEQQQANRPRCIACGSQNLRKIGGLERAGSIMAVGIFSRKINKSFKCNDCGMTF